MNLNALLALSFRYDIQLSPVWGYNLNPNHLELTCDNCIGACCIGSIIAFPGQPTTSCDLALKHGCVHKMLIPEHHVRFEKPPHLFGIKTTDELLASSIAKGKWQHMFNTAIGTVMSSQNNAFQLCGPCGELQSNGFCRAHDWERPQICSDVAPGDEVCKKRFIAWDSRAAEVFQRILNRALPTLNRVRTELGLPHDNQQPFDFSQPKYS